MMSSFFEHLPSIISSMGVIVVAWFTYNQYTKNKHTDAKIEQWKHDEERKCARRSDQLAQIYGVLWQLLHDTQADRAYIVQPHPLTNSLFLSISLEVKRNGVSSMKSAVRNLPMCDVAAFAAELRGRDFMFYRAIEQEMRDKRARAILTTNGSASAIIKRLSSDEHDWIGSLFLEYTHEMTIDPTYARKELAEGADIIQYILPDYK